MSRELWDRVQDHLGNRCTYVRREQKHEFAFSGIVRCGICADLQDQGEQRLLVGEIHRQKHVYYRCDGCMKAKRVTYFKEAVIDAAMVKALKTLRLDEEVLEWIRTALRSSHGDEVRFHGEAIARLHKSYETLQRRIDIAYDDRVDGRITLDQYERKSSEWREEQKRVRVDIERHEAADQSYLEEGLALLEVAGRAWQLYESRNPTERRQLLNFAVSNTIWRDQNLEVTWRQPFDLLAESISECRKNDEPPDAKSGGHSRWLPTTGARHTLGRRGRPVFWCGVPFLISRIKKKKEGRTLGKRKGMGKVQPSVRQTKERLTALLDGVTIKTRADLARHLGVSRAYITQVLGPVVHAVHAVGEDEPHGGESVVGGGGA